MDRNTSIDNLTQGVFVALRKESVDRNDITSESWIAKGVALRKESVDRNVVRRALIQKHGQSLSARRAWIEISALRYRHRRTEVALRKESVDRNTDNMGGVEGDMTSLSARRAWIEILSP